MIQKINPLNMKKGEMYFVIKIDSIMGKIKFIKYEKKGYLGRFAIFEIPGSNTQYHTLISLCIYRYISKEEYRTKLKEKYNQTCLDIVLKRLVDESFQW